MSTHWGGRNGLVTGAINMLMMERAEDDWRIRSSPSAVERATKTSAKVGVTTVFNPPKWVATASACLLLKVAAGMCVAHFLRYSVVCTCGWRTRSTYQWMGMCLPAPPSSWLSCLNTFPSVHVVAIIWVRLSSCNWLGYVDDCRDLWWQRLALRVEEREDRLEVGWCIVWWLVGWYI